MKTYKPKPFVWRDSNIDSITATPPHSYMVRLSRKKRTLGKYAVVWYFREISHHDTVKQAKQAAEQHYHEWLLNYFDEV